MRGPSTCPECGHDPTGDDDTFQSGGGWVFENSVSGNVFTEILRCPVCDSRVWEDRKEMEGRL